MEKIWIWKTDVIRNSALVSVSLAVALFVTHSRTQTCAHTLSVKWGGAVTTHTSMQTPTVGNSLEGHNPPPPPPPPNQTESCPLTSIQPLYCSLDRHRYRCTGHSFLFVQLHLIPFSISNSLQQREHGQLVLANRARGTLWKQAVGCTALATVGASVHFVYSPCPAWVVQSWYHPVVTSM